MIIMQKVTVQQARKDISRLLDAATNLLPFLLLRLLLLANQSNFPTGRNFARACQRQKHHQHNACGR